MSGWQRFGVPLLIAALGMGGLFWLARQDKAVQVPTKQVEQGPQPPAQPKIPPGAVFRSLDTLNAAAKAVGCPQIALGDPAGRLIDLAECLGEKAMAKRAVK